MVIVDTLELALNILIVSLDDTNQLIGSAQFISLLHECLHHQLPFLDQHAKRRLILIEEFDDSLILALGKVHFHIELHKVLRESTLSLTGLLLLL